MGGLEGKVVGGEGGYDNITEGGLKGRGSYEDSGGTVKLTVECGC